MPNIGEIFETIEGRRLSKCQSSSTRSVPFATVIYRRILQHRVPQRAGASAPAKSLRRKNRRWPFIRSRRLRRRNRVFPAVDDQRRGFGRYLGGGCWGGQRSIEQTEGEGGAAPETDVGVWRGILENWRTVVVAARFCLTARQPRDPDAAKKRGRKRSELAAAPGRRVDKAGQTGIRKSRGVEDGREEGRGLT